MTQCYTEAPKIQSKLYHLITAPKFMDSSPRQFQKSLVAFKLAYNNWQLIQRKFTNLEEEHIKYRAANSVPQSGPVKRKFGFKDQIFLYRYLIENTLCMRSQSTTKSNTKVFQLVLQAKSKTSQLFMCTHTDIEQTPSAHMRDDPSWFEVPILTHLNNSKDDTQQI